MKKFKNSWRAFWEGAGSIGSLFAMPLHTRCKIRKGRMELPKIDPETIEEEINQAFAQDIQNLSEDIQRAAAKIKSQIPRRSSGENNKE